MRLKSLTYTSRARLDLTDGDLIDIHQTARHLNALDGITGLLVFDGTRFFQIIEGSEEAIDSLVDRLRRDERHLSIEIRDERLVDGRSFPDWSMELLRLDGASRDPRGDVAAHLTDKVAPEIRDLALRMSAGLSTGAC